MPTSKKPRKRFNPARRPCGYKCYRRSTIDKVRDMVRTTETRSLLNLPPATATVEEINEFAELMLACQVAYVHRVETMTPESAEAVELVQRATLDFYDVADRAKRTGSTSLTGEQLTRSLEAIQICADFAEEQLSNPATCGIFVDEVNAMRLCREAVGSESRVIVSKRVIDAAINEWRMLAYIKDDTMLQHALVGPRNRVRQLIDSERRRAEN